MQLWRPAARHNGCRAGALERMVLALYYSIISISCATSCMNSVYLTAENFLLFYHEKSSFLFSDNTVPKMYLRKTVFCFLTSYVMRADLFASLCVTVPTS